MITAMKIFLSIALSLCFESNSSASSEATGRSVILIIGDGMGYPQLEAASLSIYGKKQALFTQQMSHRGEIHTHSHSDEITDSGAAATAMGTGQKTNNGYVGRNKNAVDVPNIFEIAKRSGIHTGIITTVPISHATPAGFASHGDDRKHTDRIVDQLLSRSRPNILFGSAEQINEKWASFKGYDVVKDRNSFMKWSPKTVTDFYVSGQFGESNIPLYKDKNTQLPSLPELTAKALEVLPQPFFLLIESGMIDWGGHEGDIGKVISEVHALEDSVLEINDWMKNKKDVTVIVTADHETGGLIVEGPPKTPGALPPHRFTAPLNDIGSLKHTAQKVPVFAMGADAYRVETLDDNTELFFMMKDMLLKK